MNLWLVIITAGLLTYAIRLAFILIIGERDFPDVLKNALQFVPPAVLTAIILPELIFNNGSLDIGVMNPRLVAGIIAILVAWRTKNALLTIIFGMLTLWLLNYLTLLLS